MRNTQKILSENLKNWSPMNLNQKGENNIKMYINEIGNDDESCTHLVKGRDRLWTIVKR
jgi:hypothetical protein